MGKAGADHRWVAGVMLLVVCSIWAGQAKSFEVAFPDTNLDRIVRTTIGKPSGPIQDTDLVGVGFTALNAAYQGIVDLTGLEYCKDLAQLQLYGNSIVDLTPLASLTMLMDLYLWDNQIADISALAGLPRLRFVFLQNNRITNIDALQANPGLGQGDVVNVTGNVLDQNGLCNVIPDLRSRQTTVYYSGQCGRVVVTIPDPNLRTQLTFAVDKQPGDALYDTDLAELDHLDASNAGIVDLTGFEYCENLRWLSLAGNKISQLGPLANLSAITNLYLGGNRIQDLTPLSGLNRLRGLELQNNQISNLDGLQNLGGLVALHLHDNLITDITGLRFLLNLEVLTLGNNQIANIDTLALFKGLVHLELGGNLLTGIEPLAGLANLQRLSIWGNQVTQLDPLAGLIRLQYLDISGNGISNINVLTGLVNLTTVQMGDNEVRSLAALAGLPKLDVVMLPNNKVSALSALVANTAMGVNRYGQDQVDVRGNPLSQEVLCYDIPALLERDIIVLYDGYCDLYGITYTLTMAVRGSGTVEPPEGTRTYSVGSEVQLEATPEPGWSFDHWEGDVTGTDNPVAINMDADKRVTAVFTQTTVSHTLTLGVIGQGTTNPAPGVLSYTGGALVTISVAPAEGWKFDHWEGDLSGGAAPGTLIMDGDKTVTAVFVELGPIYKLTTQMRGNGTLDPAPGEHEYPGGTGVIVRAEPEVGWLFDHWEGALQGNANPNVVIMDGDKAVTAVFRPDGFDYTLSMVVVGDGRTAPSAGFHRYFSGTEVTVLATPNPGWVFDHWSGALSGEQNPAKFVMNSDKTLTAVFVEAPVTYTLTIGQQGSGSVTPPPGQYVYADGKVVTLVAESALGWVFDHWEGDAGGSATTTFVTMTGDKSVTAVFREYPYISSITPGTGTTLGGDEVTITGGRLATAYAATFGGAEAVILDARDTQLRVRTAPHTRGVVDVTVSTELGQVTLTGGFMYVEPPGPPEADRVRPAYGMVAGGEVVEIRGRNLILARAVSFGGEPAEILSSQETRISVITPPHAAGVVDVVVDTTTGQAIIEGGFTYVVEPQIASVNPNVGRIGGGEPVTIRGVGLVNPLAVQFGDAAASITSFTDSEIAVLTPPHAAGRVHVSVTTPGGTAIVPNGFGYYTGTGVIECQVLDRCSLKPVLDALIRLEPMGREATANADGLYLFENLLPYTYTLTATAPDCEPSSLDVTIVRDETLPIMFLLECRRRPACGTGIDFLNTKISEAAVPRSVQDSPLAKVAPDAALAVRLTADEPIDPASVWAVASGEGWSEEGGAWRPTDAADGRDGWVVFTPETPFPAGEAVTLTVGAATVGGVTLAPVTTDYAVGGEACSLDPADAAAALEEAVGVPALPGVLAAARSVAYRVTPEAVFDAPVTVRIPAPAGTDPDALDLYYYSESVRHLGWYPAENVVGWLVPGSRTVVEEDGQTWLEVQVNHGGVVQLGQTLRFGAGSAAPVEVGASGSGAQWLSLISVLLVLSFVLGRLFQTGRRVR